MIDHPLNAIVVLAQARHHQILGRHNKVHMLVAQTIQMVVTALVLLEAAHRYAARAYRHVVTRRVLHHAHHRPLRLVRVRIAFLELAQHDNLVDCLEWREAAYEEVGLEGGN